jgi:hypothetical protein
LNFQGFDGLFRLAPERANLAMRMNMRRFTRLTNAFSRKIDTHIQALSPYFVVYNFVRTHKTHKLPPAMAAGVSDRLWSWKMSRP